MPIRRYADATTKMLGVVRIASDPSRWKPFHLQQTALDAPIEDIVFGDTVEDCVVQLGAKFPATDVRLTRVRQTSNGRNYRQSRADSDICIRVLDEDAQYYAGGDPQVALALVKEYGTINCVLDWSTLRGTDHIDWRREGCLTSPAKPTHYSHITQLRYDPKRIKSADKAAKTRAKRAAVKCEMISRAAWQMHHLVRQHVTSTSPDQGGGYSRYSVCYMILEVLRHFAIVFGNNSWRKHTEFRKLKLAWKAQPVHTRKVFMASAAGYGHSTITTFCNFMDTEVRIRNGPIIDKDEDWKPCRTFPDFKEFESGAYAKTLKAHEKEDEARASARPHGKKKRAKR